MGDVLAWVVVHILCIMAHFAFMIASTFSFVNPSSPNSSMDAWDPDLKTPWNELKSHWELDRNRTTLCWMASATSCFITFVNVTYLMLLLKLEHRTIDSTSETRRFNKQIVLALGTTFNCCFVLADFAFVKAVGPYVEGGVSLGVVRTFAGIAGVAAIATVVMDLLKIYELWKQNNEAYEVLNSLEPEDW